MAKGKNFWFKFEWDRWLGDRELHRCSFETRGFWIECINLMEEAGTWFLEGTIAELANLIGCSVVIAKRSIEDLENNDAARIERKKVRKSAKSQDFVKVVSRRILKRYNLKEYNKLAKRKERQKPDVKPMSNAPSKIQSLRVLEDSSKEESKETHTNADASEGMPDPFPDPGWTYPMKDLVEAFPSLTVTPAMIGFIEPEVLDNAICRQAWSDTLRLYRQNYNPMLKRYLPDNTGTLLDVFRKKKAELEKQNGDGKTKSGGTPRTAKRSDEPEESTEDYLARIGARPA